MSSAAPLPSPLLDAVEHLVGGAVADGLVPGAVAVVGTSAGVAAPVARGVRRLGGPAVTPDTLFDLASLTKVASTLPALLRLASDGSLDLDAPLKGPFPNAGWFREPSLGERSARELLTHTAGLPAWAPLMGLVSTRRTAIGHALASELPHPRGEVRYSDLGFIVAGALVEVVGGVRQDRFHRDTVVGSLAIDPATLGYRPSGCSPAADDVAATERCGWRDRLLEGEVHDEGAWIMDGVAGHAGLFGTGMGVARYAQAWLRRDPRLADPALLDRAVRRGTRPGLPARGLGWVLARDGDEPPADDGGGGGGGDAPADWRGPRGFGHTGFTGTSLWIDPEADRFCALLTNRVHPTRHGGHGITRLRHDLHRIVFGSPGAAA